MIIFNKVTISRQIQPPVYNSVIIIAIIISNRYYLYKCSHNIISAYIIHGNTSARIKVNYCGTYIQ